MSSQEPPTVTSSRSLYDTQSISYLWTMAEESETEKKWLLICWKPPAEEKLLFKCSTERTATLLGSIWEIQDSISVI